MARAQHNSSLFLIVRHGMFKMFECFGMGVSRFHLSFVTASLGWLADLGKGQLKRIVQLKIFIGIGDPRHLL